MGSAHWGQSQSRRENRSAHLVHGRGRGPDVGPRVVRVNGHAGHLAFHAFSNLEDEGVDLGDAVVQSRGRHRCCEKGEVAGAGGEENLTKNEATEKRERVFAFRAFRFGKGGETAARFDARNSREERRRRPSNKNQTHARQNTEQQQQAAPLQHPPPPCLYTKRSATAATHKAKRKYPKCQPRKRKEGAWRT